MEQKLKTILGELYWNILVLQTSNEQLQAKINELEAQETSIKTKKENKNG